MKSYHYVPICMLYNMYFIVPNISSPIILTFIHNKYAQKQHI